MDDTDTQIKSLADSLKEIDAPVTFKFNGVSYLIRRPDSNKSLYEVVTNNDLVECYNTAEELFNHIINLPKKRELAD